MKKDSNERGTFTSPASAAAEKKVTICGDSKNVGTTGPGDCGGYRINYLLPLKEKEVICWSLKELKIPRCWHEAKGEGVIVAVLDTGIAYDHPDFCGKYAKRDKCKKRTESNENGSRACEGCEANAIIAYRDFTCSSHGAEDNDGHGTHVAGIIAARKNASGVVGVAPKAKLLIGKVLGDKRTGTHAQLAEGIEWAIERGAHIISMSLQSDIEDNDVSSGNDPVDKAIKKARENGIVVVCSAGNNINNIESNSQPADTVKYPAKFPEVISVGAIDRQREVPAFSCHGDRIDIVAPGDRILSSYPPNLSAVLSGTSMAAPFVSGVLALILSDKTSDKPKDRDEIIERLKREAIDIGPVGRDTASGFGVINPEKLLCFQGSRIQYKTGKTGKSELVLKILKILPPLILTTVIAYLLITHVL
jgi:subtilisin family serine protease